MDVTSLLAGPFMERDGVYYTVDPPTNTYVSRDGDPTNPQAWSFWRRENFSFFKNQLTSISPGSVIIDLGAGRSDFRELFTGFKVCAVDFYPYPGISVVADLSKHLPFRDSCADVIVLSNVLEHMAEPDLLFEECRRLLKPGGTLLATVPFMIEVHQRPYDFWRYTDINLERLLRRHGFEKQEIIAVSKLDVLLYNILARFFRQLIERTNVSTVALVQKAYVFLTRVVWKVIRVILAVSQPIFRKSKEDNDAPLGYCIKTKRPL